MTAGFVPDHGVQRFLSILKAGDERTNAVVILPPQLPAGKLSRRFRFPGHFNLLDPYIHLPLLSQVLHIRTGLM